MDEFAKKQLSPEDRVKAAEEMERLLKEQSGMERFDPLSNDRTPRHPRPSEEIHERAYQVLLDAWVEQLPVGAVKLCRKYGAKVKLVPGEKNRLLKGNELSVTENIDGVPYILIAKDHGEWDRRFAAARELGHIVLGHIPGTATYDEAAAQMNRESKELEASTFADALLAPNCVLDLYGVPRDTDGKSGIPREHEEMIEVLCRVGHSASRMKYYTYNIWQSRIECGEITLSETEKKLIQRFRTAATLYKMQKRMFEFALFRMFLMIGGICLWCGVAYPVFMVFMNKVVYKSKLSVKEILRRI